MVFEADFVARRDHLVDEGEGRDGLQHVHVARRSRPGPDASAVEIGGDLFVTFRDNPAIEAFVKFLATRAGRRGLGEAGRLRRPATTTCRRASIPTRSPQATEAPIRTAKSVVFDMSDEQPPAFGATTGQGEWGLFQDVPEEPQGRHRHRRSSSRAAAAAAYKKGK